MSSRRQQIHRAEKGLSVIVINIRHLRVALKRVAAQNAKLLRAPFVLSQRLSLQGDEREAGRSDVQYKAQETRGEELLPSVHQYVTPGALSWVCGSPWWSDNGPTESRQENPERNADLRKQACFIMNFAL